MGSALMLALTVTAATVHAACGAAPAASSDGALRLKSAGSWTTVSALVTPSAGDMVYDTTNNVLSVCNGTTWTTSSGGGGSTPTDRISATDNYSMVVANPNPGTVSFTLGNTAGAAYLHPTLGFVGPGVSTTGGISGTTGYFSGNVGIGTTAPTERLHIYGTNPAIKLEDPATSNSNKVRWRVSGDNLLLETLRANNTIEGTPLSIGLQWANTSTFTIAAQANAGLQINRPTTISSTLSFGDIDTTIQSLGDGILQFKNNGISNLYLKAVAAANLGVGIGAYNTSPNGTLHVYDATSSTGITRLVLQEGAGQSTNELLGIYANDGATPRLAIKSGNVGIGTTAPSGTLHISGTAFMSRYSAQPVACGANYNGLLAMTSTARLCACDGSSWKYADGTGNACAW